MNGAAALGATPNSTLVAIGNFDGVHRGHQAVLHSAIEDAKKRSLSPVVLTFDPHPAEVLGRGRPPMLTTPDRRVQLLCRLSPDLQVVVERFTKQFAASSPEDFARSLLAGKLGAKEVVVGENFGFGRGRSGNLQLLQEVGAELGFTAVAEPLVADDAGAFSSSRIRGYIAEGKLAEAAELLGRPHSISGVVVEGAKRGRTIGFPTANLEDIAEESPPDGVYACLVDRENETEDGAKALGIGALNIGHRPTVADGASVEVHLLDFDGGLYGQRLRLHLIESLRPEQRFDGLDALKAQIAKDVADARAILEKLEPDPGAFGGWR